MGLDIFAPNFASTFHVLCVHDISQGPWRWRLCLPLCNSFLHLLRKLSQNYHVLTIKYCLFIV